MGGGQEVPGCHYNMPQDSYLIGHFNITLLLVLEHLICIGYIPRCRTLCYLHNRGPKARGRVNRVETEPRYITDLYHGLRGPDDASSW